jgi:hypothetical protein
VRLHEPVLYSTAGLVVRSRLWLPARPERDQEAPHDVEFVFGGARAIAPVVPSEQVLADLVLEGAPQYTFCRMGERFVGRFYGLADFEIDAALARVVCHPVIAGPSQDVPIVMAGAVASFLAAMRGRFILHASAIDLGGRAVAFAGERGQGKTTMATLFCVAGFPLVTDDVLPLDIDEAPGHPAVYGHRSGFELRLRTTAATLIDRFPASIERRVTSDDRRAIRPVMSGRPSMPVAAIILPRPDRESSSPRARRLGVAEAGLALHRCTRTEGWRDPGILRRNFSQVSQLVETVPVYAVDVPWGPPFDDDLAARVLGACGIDAGLEARAPVHAGIEPVR